MSVCVSYTDNTSVSYTDNTSVSYTDNTSVSYTDNTSVSYTDNTSVSYTDNSSVSYTDNSSVVCTDNISSTICLFFVVLASYVVIVIVGLHHVITYSFSVCYVVAIVWLEVFQKDQLYHII